MKRFNLWVASFVFGLFLAVLSGCGGGGDDGASASLSYGASASLSWSPVIHQTAIAYTVHFGKQPSGGDGSCDYENSVNVSEPSAFITGLEFTTQYYFAVSAYTEDTRSQCSDEVSKLTPEAPGPAGQSGFRS